MVEGYALSWVGLDTLAAASRFEVGTCYKALWAWSWSSLHTSLHV